MCADYSNDEIREMELSLDKRYKLPSSISVRKQDDVYLAIHTEGISWIVLYDDLQLSAFQMLRSGESIGAVLERYGEEPVSSVVTQIEAKRFYDTLANERTERNLYVLLTNRCNQRCRHCYMYAGEYEFDELDPRQWKTILDAFKRCGGDGITFTGGEVTVYDGYVQIIRYAHELGLSVTVLTNGILWSQDAVNALHSCIDEVQVSIDGYDSESYRAVRQYDGFEKALSCIRRFYEAGVRVSMAVTPLFDNLDSFVIGFEQFAREFMKQYPEVFIKLNLELIQGREVKVSREENIKYKKALRRLMERLYPDYYIETFALNFENHTLRRNCGFGEITIAANGDVYWCNRIPELRRATNAVEDDFESIMLMSDAIKLDTSVDNTRVCKECDIRYICGGGCRLEYEGIQDASVHSGEWYFQCPGKDEIYNKMILSNEFFFD